MARRDIVAIGYFDFFVITSILHIQNNIVTNRVVTLFASEFKAKRERDGDAASSRGDSAILQRQRRGCENAQNGVHVRSVFAARSRRARCELALLTYFHLNLLSRKLTT